MADNVGTVSATLELDTRKASQQWRRFQGELARSNRNANGLGTISKDARQFEAALGAATNRVTAFAAAAGVFTVLSKSVSAFVRSIVEVDGALARINVNLNETSDGLKKFSADIFNVARQTGQTFEVTAKAAEELARQGLTAEETTRRLKDSLMLARIASIDSTDAVEALTAAVNSFSQSAVTSFEVVNKFAAVDTKFAVSSRDLAESISRVGSVAQSAGVGVDQLIALVTSLQQTTQRGGAVIGNGLKTIFTRIQGAPETVAALESVGVSIKDTSGNLRSAIDIFRDYGEARKRVGEAERQALDRTVAGGQQINILKAALADLTRQYSVYDSALKTSSNATDEAVRKNAELNQTLSSLINQTAVSAKQLFSAIGNQSIGPAFKELLGGVESLRKYLSGETGSEIGKGLGEGILKGITNVLSGPVLIGLVSTLALALRKVGATLLEDTKALFAINNASNARVRIQERINYLLANATETELAQYRAATSVLAAKQAILRIQERIASLEVTGSPLTNSLITKGILGNSTSRGLRAGVIPSFADPVASAISREIGAGVPASSIYVAKDSRVAGPNNPAGLLVANTRDEPRGGFQGVNRAISQGLNPKTHGTVPNFAVGPRDPALSARNAAADEVYNLFNALKMAKPLSAEFNKIGSDIQDMAKKLNKFSESKVLSRLAAEFNLAYIASKKVTSETRYSQYVPPQGGTLGEIQQQSAQLYRRSPVPASLMGGMVSPTSSPRMSREEWRRQQVIIARNRKLGDDWIVSSGPERAQSFAAQNERLSVLGQRLQAERTRVQERRLLAEQARLEQRKQRNFGRAQLAGIGISFVGGLVPEGQGGTAQGMLGGFAQGASYGGGIGGLFGPVGLAIGGVGGGLIGALTKFRKSVEEISAEIDEGVNKRQKELEGLDRYIQAQTELNEAIERGADQATLKRFGARVAEARGGLTKTTAEIASISDADERNRRREEEGQKRAREAARGEVSKGLLSGNISSSSIRQAFGTDAFSSLTPSQMKAIERASSGNFNVAPVFGEGPYDSNAEAVVQAQNDYKQSLAELVPILQDVVDVSKLTPANLAKVADALRKGILEARQIDKIAASTSASVPLRGIGKNIFTGTPDLAGVSQLAASKNKMFVGTPQNKDRLRFAGLTALAQEGGEETSKLLEQSSEFKQLRAKVQLSNIGESAIVGLGLKRENFIDERGNLRVGAVRERVKGLATTGNLEAQLYSDILSRGQNEAFNAGLNRPSSAYAGSSSNRSREGFLTVKDVLAKQSAEKGRFITKENIAQNIPQPQISSPQDRQAAIDINVKIDGALNLIAQGMDPKMAVLIQSEVNQAVINATNKYFKDIQPGLAEYNARLSKLEGTPSPPSVVPRS